MQTILPLLESTKNASTQISGLSNTKRQELVLDFAHALETETNITKILAANKNDCARMDDENPKKDRLLLTKQRLDSIKTACKNVAQLEDPVGKIQKNGTHENGMIIQRVAVPMGVVGVIYEARPNVTLDVAALCIRSGNAVVLRGGSDAKETNQAIVAMLHEVLKKHDLSTDLIQLLPIDRSHVKTLLEARDYVDILIPRGSRGLIDFVRENAQIPTIETGAGVCHTYVHSSADLEKAAAVVVNAKVTRPSVCNSLDTIVVDESIAHEFLPQIKNGMEEYNVEIFADEKSYQILEKCGYNALQKAKESDFGREFLGFKCSVKVVENPDEAIAHIRAHSSKHSEAIMAEEKTIQKRFIQEIDAAAVYTNASTRFTDGEVFGLGAEIGISTQKLHARGPFALEKLMTEKWIITGNGQIR